MCQSAGAGLYDPESMSLILNQRRAGFSEGTSLEKLRRVRLRPSNWIAHVNTVKSFSRVSSSVTIRRASAIESV